LSLYRALDDRVGIARSLSNIGAILLGLGRPEEAASVLDEALERARELGDARLVALASNNRGDVALTCGQAERAEVLFEESLGLLRELGDASNVARALFNLGAAALLLGRTSDARARLRESIVGSEELGDREDVAWCLVAFAALAARDGGADLAATLLASADALLEDMAAAPKPLERELRERTLAAARAELDLPAFEDATARGRALTLAEAVRLALEV